jgi:hypothetical protein
VIEKTIIVKGKKYYIIAETQEQVDYRIIELENKPEVGEEDGSIDF